MLEKRMCAPGLTVYTVTVTDLVDGRAQLGGALHQRLWVTASPGLLVNTPSGDSIVRFIHYRQVSGLYKRITVAQLVETLRYKLEGRGFDSRWGHWDFSLT
jgi:hypothetical protein